MSQSVSTQNFLIHDSNGKPQVIKVVQSSGPNKAWRPQAQVVGRTSSNVIKSVGGPVKQLYADDDYDSSAMYVRKSNTNSTTSSPQGTQYKYVARRPEVVQKVIQLTPAEMQAIQSQPDVRYSKSPSVTRVVMKGNSSNGKRATPEIDFYPDEHRKRRRSEKGGKGLRHFSMKVCEKVREKGFTTYNEVADELVAEFTGSPFQPTSDQCYDQKNIRRRVYDALNVLMAMNIISKEKKEIRWLGLPAGYPSMEKASQTFERERKDLIDRIAKKKKTLQTLILQQVGIKNLVARNRATEQVRGPPVATSAIHLPILVVSTNQNTTVNCSVSNDKKEYFFNFDDVFEIKDESHVLEAMGMMIGLNNSEAGPADLIQAKAMLPRALAPFVDEMVQGSASVATSGLCSLTPPDRYEEPIYLEEDSGEETTSEAEMDTH